MRSFRLSLTTFGLHVMVPALLLAAGTPVSDALAGQTTPPVQGTVALPGTVTKLYRAANVVIVTTVDGVEHVYHFAKDLVVHGGKGVDALQGLREGSTVVVHYTGDDTQATAHEIDRIDTEGLESTEGTVTRIDHGRQQITVRYDNGKAETFRLTSRAASEQSTKADADAAHKRVVIYYSNDAGQKVAHFFQLLDNSR